MKVFVFYIVLFCSLVALTQSKVIGQYGGNTTIVWYPPVLSGSSCSVSTAGSQFSYFEFDATAPGIYQISILVENSIYPYTQAFIYEGEFNDSSSCTNLQRQLSLEIGFSSSYGPVIDDFISVSTAGHYAVAINIIDDGLGAWAAQVSLSDFNNATISDNNNLWLYPPAGHQGLPCTNSTQLNSYFYSHTFEWSENSGSYDVVVGFVNETARSSGISCSTQIAVYSGTWPPSNSVYPINSCGTGTEFSFVASINQGYYGEMLENISFTEGSTYSIVVSISSVTTGSFGLFFMPTLFHDLSSSASNWAAPFGAKNEKDCQTSVITSETSSYFIYQFMPSVDSIFISSPAPSFFFSINQESTYNYFYSGSNDGNPPSSCNEFLLGRKTALTSYVTAETNYTLIISSSNYTYSPGGFIFLAYLGPISSSNNPTTTTSGASTGAVSSTTSTGEYTTISPSSSSSSANRIQFDFLGILFFVSISIAFSIRN